MVVTGDTDNKIFFENMLFNGARNLEADPFIKIVSDSTATEASKLPARTSLDDINKKVVAYQDGLLAQHPSTLTARILKSTRQIDIPAPPKKADGSIDSTFQFRYYRKHYWDNFNLRDDALIRLPRPAYQEKIKDYFTRFVPPIADSINSEIDRLAAIAKPNQETYKYFIWMCVIQFQNPTIMGLDGVFVHIIRKYFDSGEMNFWINAKMRSQLKERADQLSLSLMGMDANNLIMQDQNLKPRNMFDIKNKYTILYIFDPDCSHCRQETPKLVSFYNSYKSKFDVEVYAVSADTSIQKMKDFIKEFKTPWITVNGPRSYVGSYHKLYDADQTPSLYIIDRRRKIIAKKPPIEELVNFFNNQERLNAGK
jgi:peroxiredoxin